MGRGAGGAGIRVGSQAVRSSGVGRGSRVSARTARVGKRCGSHKHATPLPCCLSVPSCRAIVRALSPSKLFACTQELLGLHCQLVPICTRLYNCVWMPVFVLPKPASVQVLAPALAPCAGSLCVRHPHERARIQLPRVSVEREEQESVSGSGASYVCIEGRVRHACSFHACLGPGLARASLQRTS